jgi:hypothetical protein
MHLSLPGRRRVVKRVLYYVEIVSKRAAPEEGAGAGAGIVAKPMELESMSESGLAHDVK